MTVSIGVAGTLGAAAIRRIAPVVEAHGFSALWVNDTPTGDALVALDAAARVTSTLRLATGVLPVDRWSATDIIARTRALPQGRTVIGIGAGGIRQGALDRVRSTATEISEADAGIRVLVGALGPKMQALGAEAADGVLLSWLSPTVAASMSARAHDRRFDTHAALYVRAAVDPAAVSKVEAEAARYAGYPAYAAHFARTGLTPTETVLLPDDFVARLPEYESSVDEVVLRAITVDDDPAAVIEFIEHVASMTQ